MQEAGWNPLVGLSEYELRHLPTHLARAGRRDVLHRLLTLEFVPQATSATGAPRRENAWFAAKDAAGLSATYQDDVGRAWRSTYERESVGASSAAISPYLRYALMRSSVETLSGHVPDALLLALAKRRVWTGEHALSLARRRNAETPGERAEHAALLVDLLGCLGAEHRASQFSVVLDEVGRLEVRRAELLWRLVQHAAPPDQEALREHAMRETHAGGPRAASRIVPHVPCAERLALWPYLLRGFSDLQPEERLTVLTALAPCLSPDGVEEAVGRARGIEFTRLRRQALAALLWRLPIDRQLAVARNDLKAPVGLFKAARTGLGSEQAERLRALLPVLPEPLVAEMLAAVRQMSRSSEKAALLAGLASHLEDSARRKVIGEALACSRAANNTYWHAQLVAELAGCSEGRRRARLWKEALAAARREEFDDLRVKALEQMALHLADGDVAAFLEVARRVEAKDRANLLRLASAPLSDPARTSVLREALEAAEQAGEFWSRAALEDLAPHLTPELLDEGFAVIGRMQDADDRRRALRSFAPCLDERQLRLALGEARAIADGSHAIAAMVALVEDLPPDAAEDVVAMALRLTSAVREPAAKATALALIARVLPEPRRTEALRNALESALAIMSVYERSDALTALAADLDGDDRGVALTQALRDVAAHDVGGDLDNRLRRLASLMPPHLLDDALSFARTLRPSSGRAHALAALVPYLPVQLGAKVCREALQTGLSVENGADRLHLVGNLASYLPDDLVQLAISLADGIDDTTWRPQALDMLADRMSAAERRRLLGERWHDRASREERSRQLDERVKVAESFAPGELRSLAAEITQAEEGNRGRRLTGVLPMLPAELRAEVMDDALSAARRAEYAGERARQLASLVPLLSLDRREGVVRQALESARGNWQVSVAVAEVVAGEERLAAANQILDDLAAATAQDIHSPALRGRDLTEGLAALAPLLSGMPAGAVHAITVRALREIAVLPRPNLLSAFAAFLPAIRPVSGQPAQIREIAIAIEDVEAWWP